MEKEYWKSIIRSETPDGVLFIDERNDNHVHLLIHMPTATQEVLCRDILDRAYWLSDGRGGKLAIRVDSK